MSLMAWLDQGVSGDYNVAGTPNISASLSIVRKKALCQVCTYIYIYCKLVWLLCGHFLVCQSASSSLSAQAPGVLIASVASCWHDTSQKTRDEALSRIVSRVLFFLPFQKCLLRLFFCYKLLNWFIKFFTFNTQHGIVMSTAGAAIFLEMDRIKMSSSDQK